MKTRVFFHKISAHTWETNFPLFLKSQILFSESRRQLRNAGNKFRFLQPFVIKIFRQRIRVDKPVLAYTNHPFRRP